LRPYTNKDYDYLYQSLTDEGFTKDQMSFETDKTYIMDIGFFSYRMEGEYPRLAHYYLNKDKRGGWNFKKISKAFWEKLIEEEHLFYILEAPKEKPFFESFAKYYGAKEPFEETDGNKFYLVPTFGRIKK
jgi:hypothetical protein